jgi:hypothetical protein
MSVASGFTNRKKFLLALAVFAVLLAAAYLPKINHMGYLQDDWNTLFVTENRSPGELIFHFSIDRPLRGYFGLLEYKLLGTNLPGYQVSALLWRFVDTIALYLALMLIWPKRWKVNLLISALVLVYPGFHEQPHAFDYQAHLFSRMCLTTSILLSLVPFYVRRTWQKVVSIAGALLLAQVSYGLMDVYIGMEALRIGLLAVVWLQRRNTLRWWKIALYALITLLGASAFTYWRLFLFESRRASVDASAMLAGYGSFGTALIENGKVLAVNLFRLFISAFYKPLLVFGSYVSTADLVTGIGIALLATAGMIAILNINKLDGVDSHTVGNAERYYPLTLILVGLVGAIGGLAPVIFGGREITYTITGDRFSYPGSISACILLVGIIWLLKPRWLRMGVTGALVFLAVLTQFTNDVIFEKNDDQTHDVWWQMSWRAPQLEPATLLGGRIYLGILDEDYTLWGPANLIYYPEGRDVTITAEVLDETTLSKFLAGGKVISERKGIEFEKDFSNLLILSKTENACLHVIDGLHPEYSEGDEAIIREVGALSQLDRIDVNAGFEVTPRRDLFGREPVQDWCYYYQKAQLARQERDWQLAAQLGDEAIAAGYSPNDPIEWLVFLQAFAYTGDSNFDQTLAAVKSDAYSQKQICNVFTSYSAEIETTAMYSNHQHLLQDTCSR